ncbi:MAG: phage portal protein [Ignavibacteria bacterium]|nr:phage portal protein [Ignavibacteria bacterium]
MKFRNLYTGVKGSVLQLLLSEQDETKIAVTENNALTISPFFAGVNALAQSIAQLPLITYKRGDNDSRERATGIPEFDLLKSQVGEFTTSYEWRFAMMVKLLIKGNAFSQIFRNTKKEVIALKFIDHSQFKIDNGQIKFQLKPNEDKTEREFNDLTLKRSDVLHLKYFIKNGVNGTGILEYATGALGFLLAAERFGTDFFTNSAIPRVLLIHPGELGETAEKNLIQSWVEKFKKRSKWEPGVLSEGMDMKLLTIPNDQAQFLELRQFQITEIARFLRITPHKLQDLTRATFSNVVELNQEFIIDSLMPITINWQQAIQRDIFRKRPEYFCEFQFNDLIRGNLLDRFNAYRLAIQSRFMTIEQVRKLENWNELSDEEIKRNLQQLEKVNQGGNLNSTNPNEPVGRESMTMGV